MINGMEMMSPVIKPAGWHIQEENLLAIFRMLFLEEGCLQPELSSTFHGGKLSIMHEVLIHS